jgi:hypothetical protein
VEGSELLRYQRTRPTQHDGVIVKAYSGNAKLGNMAATYVAKHSCPNSCPFKSNGCYAEHDNTRGHWDRITLGSLDATPFELAKREADAIDRLPADRSLRLHVAGDSTTEEGTRLIAAACERYMKRGKGVKVYAYTHAWAEVSREAWGNVSILASCETAEQVEQARERGYATAIVVHRFGGDRAYRADGVKIIPCPQQTRDVTCSDCRLCMDDERLHVSELSIGFEIHGQGRNKARRALPMASPDSS